MRWNSCRFLLLAALLAACDRDPAAQVPEGAPVLNSLTPSSVIVGDAPFDLVLSGENFTAATRVFWNGGERPARFISAQRIEVSLDTADLNHAQTAVVRVGTAAAVSGDRQFHVQGIAVKLYGPDLLTLVTGDTYQLGSSVVSESGNPLAIGVEWKSSDPRVALVDEHGKIEAIREGSARIEVSARGYRAAMNVFVNRPTIPGPSPCQGTGTPHSQDITSSETWTRADNPHWVLRNLALRSPSQTGPATVLTLEPGVQVCAGSGAGWIERGAHTALHARGTADLPIELGVGLQDSPLHPVIPGDTTYLVHTRAPFMTGFSTHVVIDNSLVRDNVLLAWTPNATAILRNSTVYGDVDLGGEARIENSSLRSGGLYLRPGSQVRLINVRIEGSSRAGITMANVAGSFYRPPELLEARGVRVRASSTYPAILSAQGAAVLLRSQAAQDSLLKNGLDTLIVYGRATESLVVRRGLPWRVAIDERNPELGRTLGAPSVSFEPGAWFDGGIASGRVIAIGTPTDPVTFRTGPIRISQTESQLSYVRFLDAALDALRVSVAVELSNCKIARSARDAIVIEQPVSFVMRNCDIEDSGGLAVNNTTGTPVQAFGVWLRNNVMTGVSVTSPRSTPNWPSW